MAHRGLLKPTSQPVLLDYDRMAAAGRDTTMDISRWRRLGFFRLAYPIIPSHDFGPYKIKWGKGV